MAWQLDKIASVTSPSHNNASPRRSQYIPRGITHVTQKRMRTTEQNLLEAREILLVLVLLPTRTDDGEKQIPFLYRNKQKPAKFHTTLKFGNYLNHQTANQSPSLFLPPHLHMRSAIRRNTQYVHQAGSRGSGCSPSQGRRSSKNPESTRYACSRPHSL